MVYRVMNVNGLCSDVAEGGESCLTSGDRREPEENGTHSNKNLLPLLGKAEQGEEVFIYIITIYFITFLPSTIYRPLPIALMSLPMTRPSIE